MRAAASSRLLSIRPALRPAKRTHSGAAAGVRVPSSAEFRTASPTRAGFLFLSRKPSATSEVLLLLPKGARSPFEPLGVVAQLVEQQFVSAPATRATKVVLSRRELYTHRAVNPLVLGSSPSDATNSLDLFVSRSRSCSDRGGLHTSLDGHQPLMLTTGSNPTVPAAHTRTSPTSAPRRASPRSSTTFSPRAPTSSAYTRPMVRTSVYGTGCFRFES